MKWLVAPSLAWIAICSSLAYVMFAAGLAGTGALIAVYAIGFPAVWWALVWMYSET